MCMTLLMCIESKVKIPKIGSPWELKQVGVDRREDGVVRKIG